VLSAKENITEDASGILVEGMLESMAEYYSAELSQKVRRGVKVNGDPAFVFMPCALSRSMISFAFSPFLYLVNMSRTISAS